MVSHVSCGTKLYRFLVLPFALLLCWENIKQIFLSETTMPSTLLFGMQHYQVRLCQFHSTYGTGNILWARLQARTFTIGIYWKISSCLTPQCVKH